MVYKIVKIRNGWNITIQNKLFNSYLQTINNI